MVLAVRGVGSAGSLDWKAAVELEMPGCHGLPVHSHSGCFVQVRALVFVQRRRGLDFGCETLQETQLIKWQAFGIREPGHLRR